MNRGLVTLIDVEKKISDSIADIRTKFPDITDYQYSINNPIAISLGLSISEQADFGDDSYILKKNIVIDHRINYEERKNFSLFHEITHFLISSDDEIISFLMEYHAGKDDEYDNYIEYLCNLGAGEFLAPIYKIRQHIAGKKFSITLIKDLDGIFPASKPAIIFQLARVASHKCTLVVIDQKSILYDSAQQLENFHNIPKSNNQYYVMYSAISKKNIYRVGRFSIIPKHHLLRNAFEDKDFIKGIDFIPYKNGNKNHKCYCEAMFYKGKVFGLFNLEEPPSHLQPKLF